MLKLILGMLSLAISRKSVVTKLKEASELYLAATIEEEKTAAIAKLVAVDLLFAKKFSSTSTPEMMELVIKELEALSIEIKEKEESEEEIEEILSEMAQVIGGNDKEDDEAARAIVEGLGGNQESPKTITLPTVVAEA